MNTPTFALTGQRIFVAGHRGLVGSALIRRLAHEDCEIVTVDRDALDLTRQSDVEAHLAEARVDQIVVAAARVGGILANSAYPADFLYENMMIEMNLIRSAHLCGIDRLLFLGSSCIYPRDAAQPITEEALLTGPLEQTNEAYAIAKIAGIKLCDALREQHGRHYISAMPTNLYGPGDNFHPKDSHVIPGLFRRLYEAKRNGDPQFEIWGTGTPRREFLYVDDLADALVSLLEQFDEPGPINVGTGKDISIGELTRMIADLIGYEGELTFDTSKPDGSPRKLLDVSRLRDLGWQSFTSLEDGLARTCEAFLAAHD